MKCQEKMEPDPRVKVRAQGGEKAAAIPGRKERVRPAVQVRVGATGAGRVRAPVPPAVAVARKAVAVRKVVARAPDSGELTRIKNHNRLII